MKFIPLNTQQKTKYSHLKLSAMVDDEDYEWLNQWFWYAHKSKNDKTHYAIRNIAKGEIGKSKTIKMHRVILDITDPKIKGDHKNGNGLDCQRHNLRKSSNSQNGANKAAWGKSKYLGVTWRKSRNKWQSQLQIHGKCCYLGNFDIEEDAALAYNKAAIEHHGEFAKLNIIN